MRKCMWLVCALAIGVPASAQNGSTAPATPPAAQSAPAAQDQPPAHPITAAQVHEMMELTGTANLMKQMLDGMMPTIRQSLPAYVPADVLDDFEKSLLGADFEGMLVHTYQAHLSAEDADGIIAFYKTPAGQHLLLAMPAIVQQSQEAGQQLGEQVMLDVLKRHQAEIEAAKKQYEAQHPDSEQQ